MLKRTFLAISLFAALSFAADPIAFVQSKDQEVQALVKADPKISAATENKLRASLLSLFDSKEVAKQCLGKDKALWDKNAKLQGRYSAALANIIVRQNISVLRRTGPVSTNYTSTKKYPAIAGAIEVVGFTMVKNQKKPMSYIMIPVGKDWKAVDLKVGNTSTYGFLIQELLKKNKGNFELLVKDLEAKAK